MYDLLVFLSRSVDFEDETVGMAIPDSVCTDRANGISKVCGCMIVEVQLN